MTRKNNITRIPHLNKRVQQSTRHVYSRRASFETDFGGESRSSTSVPRYINKHNIANTAVRFYSHTDSYDNNYEKFARLDRPPPPSPIGMYVYIGGCEVWSPPNACTVYFVSNRLCFPNVQAPRARARAATSLGRRLVARGRKKKHHRLRLLSNARVPDEEKALMAFRQKGKRAVYAHIYRLMRLNIHVVQTRARAYVDVYTE